MASGGVRGPSTIVSTEEIVPAGCSFVQTSSADVVFVGVNGRCDEGVKKAAAALLATPPTMRDSSDDRSLFPLEDEEVASYFEEEEERGGKADGAEGDKMLVVVEPTVASSTSISSEKDGDAEQEQQQPEHQEQPPSSCLPRAKLFKLTRAPWVAGYEHERLTLERLESYLRQHGGRSMAYGHLHKAQRHFEVCVLMKRWTQAAAVYPVRLWFRREE